MGQATQGWGGALCADVTFQYMGTTDATWEADGKNVIYCVSNPDEWAFGVGSAGATLWIPRQNEDDPMEVDLALNAAELEWRVGGGSALESTVIDPAALITHELGHWLGLAHSPDPFATMYYATLPNGIQATLAADDTAGICSIYPNGFKECESDADCPGDGYCKGVQGIPVCHEPHDPAGAFCSKDYINCQGMCWVSFFECEQLCLFTTMSYDEGYCSPLCGEEHPECPAGFLCVEVEEYQISVCMVDPDYVPPEPEPGPEADIEEIVEQPEVLEVVETPDLSADLPLAQDSASETAGPADDLPAPEETLGDAAAAEPDEKPAKKDSGCADAAGGNPVAGLLLLLLALTTAAVRRRQRA